MGLRVLDDFFLFKERSKFFVGVFLDFFFLRGVGWGWGGVKMFSFLLGDFYYCFVFCRGF